MEGHGVHTRFWGGLPARFCGLHSPSWSSSSLLNEALCLYGYSLLPSLQGSKNQGHQQVGGLGLEPTVAQMTIGRLARDRVSGSPWREDPDPQAPLVFPSSDLQQE